MTPPLDEVLADMAAARAAGEIALGRFREIAMGIKGPADFVTGADRKAKLLIRERHPAWSVTGQEFPPEERGGAHRFLVDLIDGTTNILKGMDYTISIALRRGPETAAGVLLNPGRDGTFMAIRGQGAYLQRRAAAGQRPGRGRADCCGHGPAHARPPQLHGLLRAA